MLLRFLSGFSLTSLMGNTDGNGGMSKIEGPVGPDGKKLKPCCACPESKRARDACILENGEEKCSDLIEAHKECMRRMGFNI